VISFHGGVEWSGVEWSGVAGGGGGVISILGGVAVYIRVRMVTSPSSTIWTIRHRLCAVGVDWC